EIGMQGYSEEFRFPVQVDHCGFLLYRWPQLEARPGMSASGEDQSDCGESCRAKHMHLAGRPGIPGLISDQCTPRRQPQSDAPPSTARYCPVTWRDASEARNTAR